MKLDTIIQGNALEELKKLPDESIDCVITSPPYWGLRSYSTNPIVWGNSECEHVFGDELPARGKSNWGDFDKYRRYNTSGFDLNTRRGNMSEGKGYTGTENTNGAYCQICNAWRGELGLEPTFQEYIQHLQLIFDEVYRVLKKTGTCWVDIGDTYSNANNDTAPIKSLCNIPHRFAISMTDHNWIQRNTLIWWKPSCMPSSAKDRFTVDFEYVFFFVKNKKYYFEQLFEPLKESSINRANYDYQGTKFCKTEHGHNGPPRPTRDKLVREYFERVKNNPDRGRNKRAVWRINPQPFREAHFAVFPEKLVEPMIKAGCPSDGVVLDPFVGSGTTCLVARKLGRHYIGIDLQPDYVDMANKRLQEVL